MTLLFCLASRLCAAYGREVIGVAHQVTDAPPFRQGDLGMYRRLVLAMATAAFVLACGPAAAGAATPGHASNDADGISYTSAAGHASTITVDVGASSVRITDSAVDPVADDGCTATSDPHTVACDRNLGGTSFDEGKTVNVDAGDQNDIVTIENHNPLDPAGFAQRDDTIVVNGGAGDDTITGSDLDEVINGGPGADSMTGGGGIDWLSYADRTTGVTASLAGGDAGAPGEHDTIGAGFEDLVGGAGDDHLTGDGGPNEIVGGGGGDTIDGGGGADELEGFADPRGRVFPDTATSADGNDTFDGGAGDDVMEGDAGGDTFDGGSGTDEVDYFDHNTFDDNGDPQADPLTVTMGDAMANDGSAFDGAVGHRDNVGDDVEDVRGGVGADTITGNASDNDLVGDEGDDTLSGGGGDDTLDGGDGDDHLHGDGGNDYFAELDDSGADTMDGGTGVDTVDYYHRGLGVNVSLDGVADDGNTNEHDNVADDVETVNGTDQDDTMLGGEGPNTFRGFFGNDHLAGAGGDDVLTGGPGNDTLLGGDDDDRLYGGTPLGPDSDDGRDTFSGGDGDDVIEARDTRGDASIDCGTGNDTAYFDNAPDPARTDCETEVPSDESAQQTLTAHDGLTTDTEGAGGTPDGTTATDPIETTIDNPIDGQDQIAESSAPQFQLDGVDVIPAATYVKAPTATAGDGPYVVTVDLDASVLPVRTAAGDIRVGHVADGSDPFDGIAPVASCADGGDPCVESQTDTAGGVSIELHVLDMDSVGTFYFAARPAHVATVIDGQFRYDGGDDDNDVTLDIGTQVFTLTDTGAAVSAGVGCATVDSHEVTCTRPNLNLEGTPPYYVLDGGAGDDHLTVTDSGALGFGNFAIAQDKLPEAVGAIYGGPGDDTLAGGDANEELVGGSDADTISGGGGNDTVDYSDHTDDVTVSIGGAAHDDGGTEDGSGDTVAGDVENVIGGAGDDTLTGDGGPNTLIGGGGSDELHGGGGNDVLLGLAALFNDNPGPDGDDTLDGGAGTDLLFNSPGADTFSGGTGSDEVSYAQSTDSVDVSIGDGANDGNLDDENGADNVEDDVESLVGTNLDDTLVGNDDSNFLDGGRGADHLMGMGGDDVLDPGDDSDSGEIVEGGEGDDHLVAGNSRGSETYDGGPGIDTVTYNDGFDSDVDVSLDNQPNDGDNAGGEGDNVMDTVENIVGSRGNDELTGSNSSNRIEGGDGDDTIVGGGGDDRLYGGMIRPSPVGDGTDTFEGDAGDDVIHARDATQEDVDCGADTDTVYSDQAAGDPPATDSLDPNCESVDPDIPVAVTAGPDGDVTGGDPTFEFTKPTSQQAQCSLDSGPPTACTSPSPSYPDLTSGDHVFHVSVVEFGHATPTVATRSFHYIVKKTIAAGGGSVDSGNVTVIVPGGAGGGDVTIDERAATSGSPPSGFTFAGGQVTITSAATTSVDNPLQIEFTIPAAVLVRGGPDRGHGSRSSATVRRRTHAAGRRPRPIRA